MGRRIFVAAGTVAVVMAASPTGYARTRQRPVHECAPRHSMVLLSDRHTQVYSYRFGIYGCLRRGGSPDYLGHMKASGAPAEAAPGPYCVEGEERCGVVSDEALAGTVVAYAETRVEASGRQPERIVVRSISTGRVLHEVSLYVATLQRTMVEEAQALRIAVNSDGVVGWIQEDWFLRHGGATPPPVAYDVFAIDGGGFHSLRIDLPVKPGSLKLVGGVLSWTQEGISQSEALH